MIYTGLKRVGEIADVKAHGGADVAEVYGGINESNPIYYKTRTITGQTPLSYKSLSKPLTDYLISGNTVQNGTPTPEAPVDVVGCGEKTENLFDKDNITDAGQFYIGIASGGGSASLVSSSNTCMFMLPCKPNTTYTVKRDATTTKLFVIGFVDDGNLYSEMPVTAFAYNDTAAVLTATSTSGSQYLLVYYAKKGGSGASTAEEIQSCLDTLMVVEGSTAPVSYIPFGYKLPLTVNGTEYPIYIGNAQTTRKIKKLVLTGEEGWLLTSVNSHGIVNFRYPGTIDDRLGEIGNVLSSHFKMSTSSNPDVTIESVRITAANILYLRRFESEISTVSALQQWLADQYANGTPVTVWYVLATPETGIVNEPLMKIGDYADTISFAQAGVTIPTVSGTNTLLVDTTVQPSSVSITGNIKEVQGI